MSWKAGLVLKINKKATDPYLRLQVLLLLANGAFNRLQLRKEPETRHLLSTGIRVGSVVRINGSFSVFAGLAPVLVCLVLTNSKRSDSDAEAVSRLDCPFVLFQTEPPSATLPSWARANRATAPEQRMLGSPASPTNCSKTTRARKWRKRMSARNRRLRRAGAGIPELREARGLNQRRTAELRAPASGRQARASRSSHGCGTGVCAEGRSWIRPGITFGLWLAFIHPWAPLQTRWTSAPKLTVPCSIWSTRRTGKKTFPSLHKLAAGQRSEPEAAL